MASGFASIKGESVMITMQEMVKRFKPIFNRVEDKKETFENSIKIPYPNLEQICEAFVPGECYSFFGGAEDNALWMWRINLLWQLAKGGVPIHILEGGKEFDNDFCDLLCLQAGVDRFYFSTGYLSVHAFQALQKSLECIANYPITWHKDEDVPEENRTSVCMKTVSLEDWQNFEPTVLWPQVQERNKVLFLFVNFPKGVSTCWSSIYARNRIILPEEFSSYIGFVQLQEFPDFNLHVPRKELHLNIRNTRFLTPGSCSFDYDRDTGKIDPANPFIH